MKDILALTEWTLVSAYYMPDTVLFTSTYCFIRSSLYFHFCAKKIGGSERLNNWSKLRNPDQLGLNQHLPDSKASKAPVFSVHHAALQWKAPKKKFPANCGIKDSWRWCYLDVRALCEEDSTKMKGLFQGLQPPCIQHSLHLGPREEERTLPSGSNIMAQARVDPKGTPKLPTPRAYPQEWNQSRKLRRYSFKKVIDCRH